MKKKHVIIREPVSALLKSLLVALLFLHGNLSFAITRVYLTEENFKGYSIERLPAPPGNLPDYVAAGTYYGDNGEVGYHFMHLQPGGIVMTSKIVYDPNFRYEMRVVDIVAQDNDNIWITLQVKDLVAGTDFIYAEKVDITGNLAAPPNKVSIQPGSNQNDYLQLYPTHSLLFDNALYICGYASDHTPAANMPTAISLGKHGAIFKADLNVSPHPVVTTTMWNTPDGTAFDYDMALRMKQSMNTFGQNEIILTGGMNSSDISPNSTCGILAMRFDANINPLAFNGVFYTTGYIYQDPTANGDYGIDLVERFGNEVIILANTLKKRGVVRWGLARVTNTGMWASGTSYVGMIHTTGDDWGTQLFTDPNNAENLDIVGYTVNKYMYCPNPMNLPSSVTNINPFVAKYGVSWGSGGLLASYVSHTVHESLHGTNAAQLDFGVATPSVSGSDLENLQFLHTATTEMHNTPIGDYVSMVAYANPSAPVPFTYLNSKFMELTNGGTSSCSEYSMCDPDQGQAILENNTNFDFPQYELYYNSVLVLTRDDVQGSHLLCSQGFYKSTGIENTEVIRFEIYPNPATSELNISIDNAGQGSLEARILNMTGMEVLRVPLRNTGNNILNVGNLARGMYFVQLAEASGNIIKTQKIALN